MPHNYASELVHTANIYTAVQGRDYLDQLRLTVKLLGTVSPEDLEAFECVALSGPFFTTRANVYVTVH